MTYLSHKIFSVYLVYLVIFMFFFYNISLVSVLIFSHLSYSFFLVLLTHYLNMRLYTHPPHIDLFLFHSFLVSSTSSLPFFHKEYPVLLLSRYFLALLTRTLHETHSRTYIDTSIHVERDIYIYEVLY